MKRLNLFYFGCFALIFCFGTLTTAQAQLHVTTAGDVGIGTTTPNGKLQILSSSNYRALSNYNEYAGNITRYGVYNRVYDPTNSATGAIYGIYNFNRSQGQYHMGIYNYQYQATDNNNWMYGAYNYLYSRSGTGQTHGDYTYVYRTQGTGNSYGVRSYMNGSTNHNGDVYGVHAQIIGYAKGTKIGVYSTVPTTNVDWWAACFDGNVHITGSLTVTSDERKKQDVVEINDALTTVMQLEGKSYNFDQSDDMNLPTEKQYGFMAQQLEQVLPELVRTVKVPGAPGATEPTLGEEKDGNPAAPIIPATTEANEYKSVNYMALIPILVEAIKEQQAEIDLLKSQANK